MRAVAAHRGVVFPWSARWECFVTFTDLAFDGAGVAWRIVHHCHAVPETMARPARAALAALDASCGGPVMFAASGGGAVALQAGGVPFGSGADARVLAQACARLAPPSRAVLILGANRGPLLGATLLLPWTSDGDEVSAPDLAALAAVVSLRSASGAVDSGLIRMAWNARPAVVTTLLPGLTHGDADLIPLHECVLGLAAHILGGPRRARATPGSLPAWTGASARLAIGQPRP